MVVMAGVGMLLEEIVQSVELWLKLIGKPEPYVDPNLDPVLLVPGIAGSILHAVNTDDISQQERVWVRILGADYKFRTRLWSLFDPSTGKSVSLDPKTTIKVPEDRNGLYAIDILDPEMVVGREGVYYFHDMIAEMTKWGYQEGKTLFGFGYDFRQSNRFPEAMEELAKRLEAVFTASGGKKINIISHSMGGLLVKCFMCLHSDVFEKYVKNWIAIAAPFQGAPGYITSTFLNGVSFVEGWQQNFFISKWSMHQLLIECPSIYELMPHQNFNWQTPPCLKIWRQTQDSNGESNTVLETHCSAECISIYKEALAGNMVNYGGVDIPLPFNLEILKWANETHELMSSAKLPDGVKFFNIYGTSLETPHSVCYGSTEKPITDLKQLCFCEAKYICVDGDGTVPVESSMADGLNAEARVGVPGEHRGILNDRHVFRILKHWLKAEFDPFYNPINDYVILPTAFEIEKHQEKGLQVTSIKEEWEIVADEDNLENVASSSSISVSSDGEKAHATVTVHPLNEQGKHHVELNALSIAAPSPAAAAAINVET